ncbi:phenylpyruvate tautomerase MIF-related protein [Sulfuriflexus mobilis]|uniref:phenylpyruvate tautomerase MIF-related protein n=1 Tax=Sulfuriflexus mobilis TaxID=1811807 RepID=UPI000F826CB6|nr:phenylpyruvate tautomerase MIF-related protein [Sulfuriflexus mobilis]
MPLVKIQSNVELDATHCESLLKAISSLTAEELGKPERYVMVAIEPTTPMLFAGSPDPTCYIELKSIGLPEAKTADLSRILSLEIEKQLGVAKERVYIEFADAPRKMWGWNGGTF